MQITCTVDQLRKIRDDAFEAAATMAEQWMDDSVPRRIRAMKLEPVEVKFENKT